MSAMRPMVSVILPTYNRAYILKRAIDSVLAQTYPNFELIVIDDGSTDNTMELLSHYHDPRLVVLAPGKRGGAAAARNRGIEVAKGDYVAFQDSDDEWFLEKLDRQVTHIESYPDASVSVCGSLCVPVEVNAVGYRGADILRRVGAFMTLMRYGNQFSTPAWLIRRSKLDQVGPFDESFLTWEDWELSMRLDAIGGFVALDEPLYIAYDTRGSVKANKNAFAATLEAVMRKHPQWVSTSRRVLSRHYWLMATWERASDRPVSARRYFVKSFLTDPTHFRTWITVLRRAPELLFPTRGSAATPGSPKLN